jgi:hypothetical protein
MLNKIADLEKMVHRKIVHHDEFCYWLKLMYLFLLHPVYFLNNFISVFHINKQLRFSCFQAYFLEVTSHWSTFYKI